MVQKDIGKSCYMCLDLIRSALGFKYIWLFIYFLTYLF